MKNYVEFLVKDPELINIFLCPESTANFDNKRIEQVKNDNKRIEQVKKSGILHCFIELLKVRNLHDKKILCKLFSNSFFSA